MMCSIFVWIMIKMQWMPLIINGKTTGKALVCLYEKIYFICIIYLFDLGLVLEFLILFCYLTYFNFTKKCAPFCLRNNEYNFLFLICLTFI